MGFQRSIGSNKKNETETSIFFILNVRDQKVPKSTQNWTFKFELLNNYDPWSFEKPNVSDIQVWSCETFVKINTSSVRSSSKAENDRTSRVPNDKAQPDTEKYWLLIAIIVSLLLAQTSYIVYRTIRSCQLKNKKNDKDPVSLEERRESKPERNIANRAPLPLPLDEVIKNEPLPPVPESPISYGQPCYYYASTTYMPADNSNECEPDPLPMKSYINKGLETSEERVTSSAIARRHMEGSLIPKQSYKNKALSHSVKEIRSPNFSRSHEGILVQKESYRNKALAKSLEELKSPNFGRRHEGPLVPKQSFKNTALDDVDEEVQTPSFARRQIEAKLAQFPLKGSSKSIKNPSPVVPQKPYRTAALDDSDEEIKTPGSARRQIEAKLTQLTSRGVGPSKSFKSPSPVILQKPYRKAALDDSDEEIKIPGVARRQLDAKQAQLPSKGFSPSVSFKIPKPLPRASLSSPPPSPPEKPTVHPARRQEPGPPSPPPPLHPKKPGLPVFQAQEDGRPQDSRRYSDDEWQYEKLQPISKYLDDFTVKPYE